jgi:Dyp-type peroxidase family
VAATALMLDDLPDIQALVLTSWKRLPHAAYVFATFDERRDPEAVAARRRWLAALVPDVSTCAEISVTRDDDQVPAPAGATPPRLQLALSAVGLAALGATPAELAGLADEAKQGMYARARILGDGATPAWELGGAGPRLGALVACFAPDATALEEMIADHTARLVAIDATVVVERTQFLGRREHFGYADGLSQPCIAGTRKRPDPDNEVPTGEILLGYLNAYDRMPKGPRGVGADGQPLDLGKNGTYLVFRKLEQHVERFWGYFAEQARALLHCGYGPGPDCTPAELDAWTDWLAAKAIGRWRSGAPLSLSPEHEDPAKATPEVCNDFRFAANDPHGERCPIGSHIRRANPRDARGAGETPQESLAVVRRHRLVRRGRSWGPPMDREAALTGQSDGQRRGLLFISLQASIARGFEFVQQTWLSNLGFARLNREGDPLAGGEVDPRGQTGGDVHDYFTIPVAPIRIRLVDRPQMVSTTGGEYFFLPSLTALRHWSR